MSPDPVCHERRQPRKKLATAVNAWAEVVLQVTPDRVSSIPPLPLQQSRCRPAPHQTPYEAFFWDPLEVCLLCCCSHEQRKGAFILHRIPLCGETSRGTLAHQGSTPFAPTVSEDLSFNKKNRQAVLVCGSCCPSVTHP